MLGPGRRVLDGALAGSRPVAGWLVPSLAGAVMVGGLMAGQPVRRDNTVPQRRFLAQVLQLTRPEEPVFDLKGETVFRRRPYYFDLETITRYRIRRGLLRDTVADSLVASGTCVVVGDEQNIPPKARAFMNAHYLPVGSLRAVGAMLEPGRGTYPRSRSFDIPFTQEFAVITRDGPVRGDLDGTPYRGPRVLAAGGHTYLPAPGEGRAAAIWAPAIRRGFSPFPPRCARS